MNKLDGWVDPTDVVNKGSQHQHAVGERGVACGNRTIAFHDAGVVSPVTAANPASIFQLPLEPLTGPVTGFASLMMQNTFSTNTPLFQWDGNYRFRYTISVAAAEEGAHQTSE